MGDLIFCFSNSHRVWGFIFSAYLLKVLSVFLNIEESIYIYVGMMNEWINERKKEWKNEWK